MRAFVLVVLLAAGAWFGGRALGWFGGSKADNAAPTARGPALPDPVANPPQAQPRNDSSTPQAQAITDLTRERAQADAKAVDDAVATIAAGKPVDRTRIESVATQSTDSGLRSAAQATLDSDSSDAWSKWLAMSQVYVSGRGAAADRAKIYATLIEVSRGAFRAPGSRDAVSDYTVVAGDALAKICDRMKRDQGLLVTPGVLKWANSLRGDVIRVGQSLKIPKEPISIEVSKGSFRLRLFLGKGLVREYQVAVGRENRTPIGTLIVQHLIVKAPWHDPVSNKVIHFGEPGYAIGTRWIGLEDTPDAQGIGIHGTNEPESVGTAASLGCIRMKNEEVEELFEFVPVGAKVAIVDTIWHGY